MLWTQFPDEFDTGAIGILLAAARGNFPNRDEAVLTAANVLGYGYKQLGSKPLAMAGPRPSEDELIAQVEAWHQQASAQKTKRTATSAVPWALILQLAMTVLQKYLGT